MMRWSVLFLLAGVIPAAAQGDEKPCVLSDLTVSPEHTSARGGLKDTITVWIPGLSKCIGERTGPPPVFTLYLDGNRLEDLQARGPSRDDDSLRFLLDRVETNRKAWTNLLRDPSFSRHVALTVGVENERMMRSQMKSFELVVIRRNFFWMWMVLFAGLLGLFLWLARSSDIIREGGNPPVRDLAGKLPRRAYSMAKTQMAVWFFLVVAAFSLIWMVTWDEGTISPGVLALIGISAGTGLAAAIVDTSKNGAAESDRKELEAQKAGIEAEGVRLHAALTALQAGAADDILSHQLNEKAVQLAEVQRKLDQVGAQLATPVTDGFVNDILMDANGISFHRFQIAVWTVILAIVFVKSVIGDLVMPDFNSTLLGLMGISSGTYIGFKFPEQKNPGPGGDAG